MPVLPMTCQLIIPQKAPGTFIRAVRERAIDALRVGIVFFGMPLHVLHPAKCLAACGADMARWGEGFGGGGRERWSRR